MPTSHTLEIELGLSKFDSNILDELCNVTVVQKLADFAHNKLIEIEALKKELDEAERDI